MLFGNLCPQKWVKSTSIATSSQGQKSSLPLRKGKKGEKTHPQSSSSSKRMFSGVPKTTADQRELLQKLYDQDTTVMSGILKAFFHSSSVIVSKEEIRKKITSFQEEIKDHTRSGSDPVLGKKNNHLYEAALFRANWALKACVSLGKKCYVEGNVSGARAWFVRAIETAEYAPAMYQWACLEERENNEAEVRRLLTLGAQRGHVDSIHNLAVLEREKGNTAEAKRLFMLAIEKGDVDSICNLAIMEYRNGNIANAIELFRLGAKKEHAVSMHNLAALEYKNNNIDNARKWYKESANLGCVSAREYLGSLEYFAGNIKAAKSALEAALNKGSFKFILLLADILSNEQKFNEAEKLYKKAISLGIKDAELHYAEFLHKRASREENREMAKKSQEMAQSYIQSLPEEERLSDQEISETSQIIEREQLVAISSPVAAPSQEEDLKPILSYEASSSSPESHVTPPMPKGYQRYLNRILAQEEAERKQQLSSVIREEGRPQTYKDVIVQVLPNAEADVSEHALKIKNLISRLANGERPAKFEELKGHKEERRTICSMRLFSQSGFTGRITFEITGYNQMVYSSTKHGKTHGVTALTILSIDRHYETERTVVNSSTAPKLMEWQD